MICISCQNPRCRRVLAVPKKLQDQICRCPACGHGFCATGDAASKSEPTSDRRLEFIAAARAKAKRSDLAPGQAAAHAAHTPASLTESPLSDSQLSNSQLSDSTSDQLPSTTDMPTSATDMPTSLSETPADELHAEPVTLADLRRRCFIELGNTVRRDAAHGKSRGASGSGEHALVSDEQRHRLAEYDARISHFLTCLSALSHANEDPTLPRRLRRPVLRCQQRRDSLLAEIGRQAFERGAASPELRRRLEAISEVERLLERRRDATGFPAANSASSSITKAARPSAGCRGPLRKSVSRLARAVFAALI